MNITYHETTNIPYASSDSRLNVQDSTDDRQPPSKKVKMAHHDVSKNSDLTPKLGNPLTVDKHNDQYSTNPQESVVHQEHNLSDKQEKKIFKCDKCEHTTIHKYNLIRHNQIHTKSNKTKYKFNCLKCEYKNNNKSNFLRHGKTHISKNERNYLFNCIKCDFKTDSNYNFTNHQNIQHNNKRANHNKLVSTDSEITLQVNDDKQPDKLFKCDVCPFASSYKESLKKHKKIHILDKVYKYDCKDYNCNCVSNFKTDATCRLNIHLKANMPFDSRKYKFKCNRCHYGSDYQYFFKKHRCRNIGNLKTKNKFKCNMCEYSSQYLKNLKKHITHHVHHSMRNKPFKCEKCIYKTDNKSNLKQHEKTYIHTSADKKPTATAPTNNVAMSKDEITVSSTQTNSDTQAQVIKVENVSDDIFNVTHCFDNCAPIHLVEPVIKLEFTGTHKQAYTYFSEIKIKMAENDKARIRKAMSFYKQLNDDDRKAYLDERMSHQKHDGSIFTALAGQNEVVATKNIAKREILGHYAGKIYTEDTYENDIASMGATRNAIDNYSISVGEKRFISGFRHGNVTSLINACKTYSAYDDNIKLPKENVAFMQHYDDYGREVVFIIALKRIKRGERLWADYGENYWKARFHKEVITDTKDNAEQS